LQCLLRAMELEWLSESMVYWILIIGLVIEFIFEMYLCYRQYCVQVSSELRQLSSEVRNYFPMPIFERSKNYAIDTNKFNMYCNVHRLVKLLVVLHYGYYYTAWRFTKTLIDSLGFWPSSWDEDIGRSMCFAIIELSVTQVVQLPISIYNTFFLEARYGFNERSAKLYITDKVTCFFINIVIRCPCVALAIYIVKQSGGATAIVFYLWAFTVVMLIILSYGYPLVIAPLYNDYTPLRDGNLKTSIQSLTTTVGFPLAGVVVVDSTRRSGHSNAYYMGLFSNKKIVISDSLMKGYTTNGDGKGLEDNEVVAVIAHELAHWKYQHTLKGIIIAQFEIILAFGAFAILHEHPSIYQAFGFPRGMMPIWPGFKIILWYLLLLVIQPLDTLMNQRTQAFEYEADRFAVELGFGANLKSAVMKMFEDNLSFPFRDKWYSACRDSHPSLLNRLDAIEIEIRNHTQRTR